MPIILVLFIVFSVGDVFGQQVISSHAGSGYNGDIYHGGGNVGIGIGGLGGVEKLLHLHSGSAMETPTIRISHKISSPEVFYWDIVNNAGNFKFDYHFVGQAISTLMQLSPEGQLSLGTETPDASAIMQINSTDKGLLIPRMTTSEKNAISSPANSLLVFDTDLQVFSYYDTGAWLNVAETSAFSDYLLISDFNNSVAGGIEETDTNNWNTAYNWGNHADAGYLTSMSEIDPVFSAHLSSDITEQDTANWNEAFSWDNHATAGYINDGNTNWDNEYGFITASSADELTNKTGNISMWTNDAGYITEAGGTFLWGRQDENTVLLNLTDNVGIGTNSPQKSLHIFRENDMSGEYEDASIRLHNYYYTSGGPGMRPAHILWDFTTNRSLLQLKFGTNSENPNPETVTKFTFNSNAMLGIGNDNPLKQLHITNENAPTIRLEKKDDGSGGIHFIPTSWDIRSDGTNLNFDFTGGNNYNPSKFKFASNGTLTATKFVGDGSGLTDVAGAWDTNGDKIYYNAGNVGIGTTNPSSKLHINNNSNGDISKKALYSILSTQTTANVTSYDKAVFARLTSYSIPSGITDNGYKIALDASSYSTETNFAGTLNSSYGVWARTGIYNASSGAKINNAIAVNAQVLDNVSGTTIENAYGVYINTGGYGLTTVNNRYDLYAGTSSAKNYFAGNVGIGTTSNLARLNVWNSESRIAQFGYLDGTTNPRLDLWGSPNKINLRTTYHTGGADLSFGVHHTPDVIVIKNNGKVGIGTSNPDEKLHLKDGAILLNGSINEWTNTGWRPRIQTPLGTVWASTNKVNEDDKKYYLGFGMTSSGWYFINRKDDLTRRYVCIISEEGNIIATKVKVMQRSWGDFIFEPDYKLTPLKELETYINNNKHLPGIPTEQEIIKEGLDLGDMQKLQMQKIEELTLYIIELNKRIEKLEKEIK